MFFHKIWAHFNTETIIGQADLQPWLKTGLLPFAVFYYSFHTSINMWTYSWSEFNSAALFYTDLSSICLSFGWICINEDWGTMEIDVFNKRSKEAGKTGKKGGGNLKQGKTPKQCLWMFFALPCCWMQVWGNRSRGQYIRVEACGSL
jgi:hypothetical protein